MTPDEAERVSDQYKWAVQALSLPAADQGVLFPDFASLTDEMEMDEELARRLFLEVCGGSLLPRQRAAVTALSSRLDAMGGEENSALWTRAALESSAEWERVRVLAREILATFGWPVEVPPRGDKIYVRGP